MISFICVLKACGNIGALYEGKQMHNMIHCNSGLFCILSLANLILIPMEDIFYRKKERRFLLPGNTIPEAFFKANSLFVTTYKHVGHNIDPLLELL